MLPRSSFGYPMDDRKRRRIVKDQGPRPMCGLTRKSSAAAVAKSGGNKNSRGRLQRLVRPDASPEEWIGWLDLWSLPAHDPIGAFWESSLIRARYFPRLFFLQLQIFCLTALDKL